MARGMTRACARAPFLANCSVFAPSTIANVPNGLAHLSATTQRILRSLIDIHINKSCA